MENTRELDYHSFILMLAASVQISSKLIADYLTELKYKFDIIAISETWLSMHTQDDYELEGYEVCHKVRNTKPGGGVACYVKREHTCKYIHDLLECVTVEIMIRGQVVIKMS